MKVATPYFMVFILLCLSLQSRAQEIKFTKTGHIWFFSSTPIEDIEAHNHKVVCAFDKLGNILEFKVKITEFEFDNALMQEHFNENYMESDKFEYASFKGSITNWPSLKANQNGTYKAEVSGKLTIHGVTQQVKVMGDATLNNGNIHLKARFDVAPANYNIKIPKIVVKNIAEIIQVNVDVQLNTTVTKP